VSDAGRTVLIMAGGTGGHIFPGLAVADCLRRDGVEVRWLGARGAMECQRVPAAGIPLDVVDIAGLRGKGLRRWLVTPFKLAGAVLASLRLMASLRPACAVSFGGYAAGPGGLAARLRGVPLLVHEQNRVPGLTNRVLARFARRVLQAFPGTWPERLNALTCGNPVRRDVVDLPAPETRLQGRSGPVRVLVTGGSQGARALNRLVPAALGLLADGLRAEVRHQCGRGQVDETLRAYREAGIDICGRPLAGDDEGLGHAPDVSQAPQRQSPASGLPQASPEFQSPASGLPQALPEFPSAASGLPQPQCQVTEFIEDMASAYGWADVVVCRSGALTVSEVAAAGLPAVFVPFPHAVDDHQTRNAEFLAEAGAALLLPEAGLDARAMADALGGLLGDPGRRLDMACKARARAVPDSAERVAGLCREYLVR